MIIEPRLEQALHKAVCLETIAFLTYGHLAQFVSGFDALAFVSFFEAESLESATHLSQVRGALRDFNLTSHQRFDLDLNLTHLEQNGVIKLSPQVLQHCLEMEEKAFETYVDLVAKTSNLPTHQRLFESMADQELHSMNELRRYLK